jgi:transcriptional regulator with XRE-family HTH domain
LRLERGLSQRQLASRGVSYAYISRIESGQRTPSVHAIRLLARRLGVAPEYLESGADIGPVEALELRLTDAELRLRLGDHSAEGRHALQAVLKEAQRAGESEIAIRAQISVGLSSLAAGNEREAAQYLTTAVDSPLVSPRTHTNVYVSLSKALRFLGRADEAATMLEDALDELGSQTPEAGGIRLRIATYLSYALTDLGQLERARSVLEDTDAGAALDPHEQVTMHWSLARLAYMEGQPRAALREIRRAIILLDHTEDSLELARAHLFAAEVHLWADNIPEAERHLASQQGSKTWPPMRATSVPSTRARRWCTRAGATPNALVSLSNTRTRSLRTRLQNKASCGLHKHSPRQRAPILTPPLSASTKRSRPSPPRACSVRPPRSAASGHNC